MFDLLHAREALKPLQYGTQARACGMLLSYSDALAPVFEVSKYGQLTTYHVGSQSDRSSCGSPRCPRCRVSLMDDRRNQIQACIDAANSRGYSVSMLTLTAPHSRYQSPESFVAAVLDASRRFKRSRFFHEHVIDYVSTSEYTHGVNGLHYHFHLLIAHDSELSHSEFHKNWSSACVNAGLREPSLAHGVHLQSDVSISDYVAKWSIVAEVGSPYYKHSKAGNRTILQLENDFLSGDKNAGRILKRINKIVFRKRVHTFSRKWSQIAKKYANRVKSRYVVAPGQENCVSEILKSGHTRLADLAELGAITKTPKTLEQQRARFLETVNNSGFFNDSDFESAELVNKFHLQQSARAAFSRSSSFRRSLRLLRAFRSL